MAPDDQQINSLNEVMHSQPLIDSLNEAISAACGTECRVERLVDAHGGCISRAVIAETTRGKWFVKINRSELFEMFAAEADGLRALAASPALRVPRVACTGRNGAFTYLVLEYIDIRPLRDAHAPAAGQALATLHRIGGAAFGWNCDNFIGSTPQTNRPCATWPEFFARERLLPQLVRARHQGHGGRWIEAGERLAGCLHVFFADYRPQPSLVHGDLWHGNAGVDASGRLVLFDPAVYLGDRETDLAMSELFGGFPAGFHAAYREAWPLAAGHAQRKTLYNLYHVLNHLNLFGGSYREQAERMIGTLLAELG